MYFWSQGNKHFNQVTANMLMLSFCSADRTHICVQTYRDKEFFDLLQSMTHSRIRFGGGSEHLDQHVKIFVKVIILCLSTLSKFFFLLTQEYEKINIYAFAHFCKHRPLLQKLIV